jgi:hypothetical protein
VGNFREERVGKTKMNYFLASLNRSSMMATLHRNWLIYSAHKNVFAWQKDISDNKE